MKTKNTLTNYRVNRPPGLRKTRRKKDRKADRQFNMRIRTDRLAHYEAAAAAQEISLAKLIQQTMDKTTKFNDTNPNTP